MAQSQAAQASPTPTALELAQQAAAAAAAVQRSNHPPPMSSLAASSARPDEVTVRFRRWHAFGPTAYQQGQEGGFMRKDANELIRRGIAVLVFDPRRDGPAMVTK